MRFHTVKLVPLLAAACLLAGCTGNTDEIQVVNIWPAEGEAYGEEAEAVQEAGSFSRHVGMVSDESGINDESFNQSAWEGLNALQASGIGTEYMEPESGDDFGRCFQTLADNGCELVWGVGYSCSDALREAAIANPDTGFAIVDGSYEDTPSNVTGVVFKAQEPSFVVGYIAASVSKTGKLGFIGGVKGEDIDTFRYGYEAGVQYAGVLYGKKVRVIAEYAGSYSDEDKGYELAKGMYENGCDVVFHAAGATGLGVIKAAVDSGHYVIGVDRDQSYLAPDNVLTSALKHVDVAVERVSNSYFGGEDIAGRTLSFGTTEGAVGIPEEHNNYRDEIYDSALLIQDKIKSGMIIPPKTEEEYRAFIKEYEIEE